MRNRPIKISIIIVFLYLYVFEFLSANESLNLSGNGTRNNPYLISSYMDLELFRDMVNSGNSEWASACYRQTCDIVFPKDKKWEPIGKLREHIPFIGEYNGDGHIISNINCEAEYAGFLNFLEEQFIILE